MQVIEFETTAHNNIIRIPNTIPEGAAIRVLLLMDDNIIIQPENSDLKTPLASIAEGMSDADIQHVLDKSKTKEKTFFEQLCLENEYADDDLALLFERDKDIGRDIAL